MDISSYQKTARRLGIILVFLLPAYLLLKYAFSAPEHLPIQQEATFVGKESCKQCHLAEYNDWLGSHHDRAMDIATDSTVLGDFSGIKLESQGRIHKMYKKDNKFFVYTDGEDGQMHEYEVKYVFGFTPLQQYLVEFDGGRLQTLPLTWNTIDSTWYHMADSIYKDEVIDHHNWLHWTNQAQNWNSMCAECHSTNLVKGYDPETDTYHTTYSEIDVSCEACHGPGSNHVEWANLPEYSRQNISNYGLIVKTSGIDNAQYVDNCVRCHSRKASLGDFDHSTASIYDHSVPNLPEEPSWFIDGQIKDEDYVYASFLQSKMYGKNREVQCNDCHNVHSGERLFDDNRLCTQCHRSDIYDTYEHHHHKYPGEEGYSVISDAGIKYDVGSGTECINCHMPGRYYMGVDFRRDHSFRIPRPDLSIKLGTPNACNKCHTDKSNEWSEQHITKWFGERRRRHYAEAFADAQNGKIEAATELKNMVADDLFPPNIRCLAIENLGRYFPDSLETIIDTYLKDPNPALRLSSVRTILQPTDKNIKRLLSALSDPTKAVRTEAAQKLMQVGENNIPPKHQQLYKKTLNEYKEILLFNSDFPLGKFNLANFYYNQNDLINAENYYKAAMKQDNQLSFIKLNLAYLYNRKGQNEKAEQLFKEYLQSEPNDAEAYYSLGLLLTEMRRYNESLDALLKAKKLAPNRPRVNHNIAMMYDFMKDKQKAEEYLRYEIQVVNNLNSRLELLKFYLDNNYGEKALSLGEEILKQYPDAPDVTQIVKQLKQQLSITR
ncbi:multiheme c-type cytochrome [Thermophagus xiamenensis]|uniref:Tetratricopeptide repeat-containing protein n=1 Tax=Thermophagus xiamenensis TaxID=385682 RepID=A0A1I2FPV5_9BACT|nr:multiheme c-type cytochrome [Thermophagus xiamenensis]SFF06808.1 Tetratricopeptide repeat-containing protein [Thermophagus xiamenensis]